MGARGQSDAPASSSACPRSSPPSSRPSLSSGELRAPCTCRQRCTVVRKCWTLLMIPFGDREVPRCLLSQIGETHSISEVRKDAHQTNLHPLASLEAEFTYLNGLRPTCSPADVFLEQIGNFLFFFTSSTRTRAARHWIVALRGSSQGERGYR